MSSSIPTFPQAKGIKVEEMSSSAPTFPDAKQIKVEEIEDDTIVWVVFPGTRIQLIVKIS